MSLKLRTLLAPLFVLAIIALVSCQESNGPSEPDGDDDTNDIPDSVSVLLFDGVGDCMRVPSSTDLQLHSQGSLTIEAWVNSRSWNEWNWVVSRGQSNAEADVLLGFDSGRARFITQNLENDLIDDVVLDTNRWYHIAGIQNGDEGIMTIYIDGMPTAQLLMEGEPEVTAGRLFIGARESFGSGIADEFFNGMIHEVRIWKKALTGKEIRELMDLRLEYEDGSLTVMSELEQYLVAHWPLNEGEGSIAYDRSGSGYDGEIVGHATWLGLFDFLD